MATATWTVYPTEGNIHHTAGEADAREWTETMHRRVHMADPDTIDNVQIAERAQVYCPSTTYFTRTGGGPTVDIEPGIIRIGGYVVEQVGAHTVTLTASSDNFIWIVLPETSALISAVPAYEIETSRATLKQRGVLLWILTTDGSTLVTANKDRRPIDHPDYLIGTYVGETNSVVRHVELGFRPSKVRVVWKSPTTADRVWGEHIDGFTNSMNSALTGGVAIAADAATKKIAIVDYGFTIEGKSSGPVASDLAISTQTYDFIAWR